jgi:methylmalonyl-CoA mutase
MLGSRRLSAVALRAKRACSPLVLARPMANYPPKWTEAATKELRGKTPQDLERVTAEGIPLKPLYTDTPDSENVPGAFPYTRGPYATMYTAK